MSPPIDLIIRMSHDYEGHERKSVVRDGPSRWTLKRKAINLADEKLEDILRSQPDSVSAMSPVNLFHSPSNSQAI